MNKERLTNLIETYIDKFEMINNDVHDENMKWKAIYHFKKYFDINALDFYDPGYFEKFKFMVYQSIVE